MFNQEKWFVGANSFLGAHFYWRKVLLGFLFASNSSPTCGQKVQNPPVNAGLQLQPEPSSVREYLLKHTSGGGHRNARPESSSPTGSTCAATVPPGGLPGSSERRGPLRRRARARPRPARRRGQCAPARVGPGHPSTRVCSEHLPRNLSTTEGRTDAPAPPREEPRRGGGGGRGGADEAR